MMQWLRSLETRLIVWLCHRYYNRHGYCISYIRDPDTSQYLLYTEDSEVYAIMHQFLDNFDRYGIYIYNKDNLYAQYLRSELKEKQK